jgi:hypothetical protein
MPSFFVYDEEKPPSFPGVIRLFRREILSYLQEKKTR